jgi:hypothetical protein
VTFGFVQQNALTPDAAEICYGFEIMPQPESVKVPFDILYTRLPTGSQHLLL